MRNTRNAPSVYVKNGVCLSAAKQLALHQAKEQERMQKEVQALAPSNLLPEVDSPADRKHSAWLGGAILASMTRFEPMWIKNSILAS